MRVLLLHEPPDGGVAQHVQLLAKGLLEAGHEPEVAGPPAGIFKQTLLDAGVPYHDLSFNRSGGSHAMELVTFYEILRLLRGRRFDLLHAHSSKAGVYGRAAATLTRTPSVYTPHCFAFIGPVSRRRKVTAVVFESLLARMTSRIICVSESEKREALAARVGSERKLQVILQGVPQPRASDPVDATLSQLRERGPVVAVVNALRPQKRTDIFLEAIPLVWRSAPSTQFAVVGSGPLEATLKQQAHELKLTDDPRFAFIPFSPPSEKFLSGLDLFVLVSDWEGLPIGLLEALAAGVPQVASDLDANREVVTSATGRLVRAGDPAALAAAIGGLLNSPETRRAMSAASVERYRSTWTLNRLLDETIATYEEVLRAS